MRPEGEEQETVPCEGGCDIIIRDGWQQQQVSCRDRQQLIGLI